MWTAQAIKHIFYSGFTANADEQLIVDICYLLNTDLLFIHKKIIATRSDYFAQLDDITTGVQPIADIAGGGNGHMALKLLAKQYLYTEGFSDIVFEQEFEGARPDVMTKDKKILVECGNTEPNKIFCYFKNRDIERVIIIPYPDQDENTIQALTFTAGDELADFLCFKELEDARQMQKFFRKNR